MLAFFLPLFKSGNRVNYSLEALNLLIAISQYLTSPTSTAVSVVTICEYQGLDWA